MLAHQFQHPRPDRRRRQPIPATPARLTGQHILASLLEHRIPRPHQIDRHHPLEQRILRLVNQ
jgi:hypothetical protein